jgi:protein-L-isoaspartate O-methyltransferase
VESMREHGAVGRFEVADSIEALAADLTARGLLTQARWRDALRAAPRHLFAPDRAWAHPDAPEATGHPIDRERAPEAWWEAVYSDSSIVLQVEDGRGDTVSGQGESSSSLSAPGVVVPFLELLAPGDHHSVLEIGTGSGWTAALLSSQLGSDQVTTVEVDAAIAESAAANLDVACFTPRLVVGDGAAGWAEGAPYDRVHATCGVQRVPLECIAQTRPGGVIAVPWMPGGSMGWQLRLTVTAEGAAVGRVHGPARYMMLRSQRHNHTWLPHHGEQAKETATRLDPRTIAATPAGARLMITGKAVGIGWHTESADDGGFSLLLYELSNRRSSWAGCYYQPRAEEFQVVQYGGRRLWDEVEAAYSSWLDLGGPEEDRLGLSVSPDGHHHLWLDTPAQRVGDLDAGHFMRERA